MTKWTPISFTELSELVHDAETELNGDLWNFWQLIKIDPAKWQEAQFGNEGNGFWVVAICGKRVIWYNDIEEGFNISNYHQHGIISEYYCNQDKLTWTLNRLFNLIKLGGSITDQAGPPQVLNP